MPRPDPRGVEKNFHIPTVGEHGLRQSVWVKGGLVALLLVGLAAAPLVVSAQQPGQTIQHQADGDQPKIGTGG